MSDTFVNTPNITLACTIDQYGITAPDYSNIFAQLQNAFWQIYGADCDLDPDTQDGQWIAIIAQAIYDNNMMAVAIFQAYSPATAQGTGLSSVVKINAIRRKSPSSSTCVVTCTGTYGTVVTAGIIGDNLNLGTQWSLPNFAIPESGTIDLTATCTQPGATTAGANTLTNILTPVLGWQTVSNGSNLAVPGLPVETDATLRQRQTNSTSLPAITPRESLYGAVDNVQGVGRLQVYQNDADTANGDGVPGHSVCVVVEGGDVATIAQTINTYKNEGTGTYGSTSVSVVDSQGVPNTIYFYVLDEIALTVDITITPLAGYVSNTATLIQQVVGAYLSTLSIGVDSYLNKLWAPANLSGDVATSTTGMTQAQLDALSATYNVAAITQAIGSGSQEAADVTINFNQAVDLVGNVVNVTD